MTLHRMLKRRGHGAWTAAAILTLASATCGCGGDAITAPEAAFEIKVARGRFVHEAIERGEIESSKNVEVRCQVQSRGGAGTALTYVIPEGTKIEYDEEKKVFFRRKDDGTIEENPILALLDSSALTKERDAQQIVVINSESALKNAREAYNLAVTAKKEYEEGTFQQEKQLVEAEIFVAEENLRRAQDYAEYSGKLARRGFITTVQLEADQFAVEKAKKDLETARTKLRVLVNYTKTKMISQLNSDINTKKALLDAAEKSFALDEAQLKTLETQIANCTIRATSAGEVVYAIERDSRGNVEANIAEGVQVRERQVLFRIPDPRAMRAKAKVHESRIGYVREGRPAIIKLDTDQSKQLRGTVTRIDSYPLPSRFGGGVREYGVYVDIHEVDGTLRPGLSAEVRILLGELENVITVPVQAILEHGGKHYCAVKNGERFTPREVEIIGNNDEYVALKDPTERKGKDGKSVLVGLKEGEIIVQNPKKYLRDEDLPKVDAKNEDAAAIYGDGRPVGAPPVNGGTSAAGGPRPGGVGGAPGTGGPGTGGPGGVRPGGAPGGAGGPGAGASGRRRMDFMSFDKDGDGKVSKDEVPEQMQPFFDRMDSNGDGAIDRDEIEEMRKRFQQGGGVPGGGLGGGGFGGPST